MTSVTESDPARGGADRSEWATVASPTLPTSNRFRLLAVPRDWAYETLLFAHRNAEVCPLLDVTEVGSARTHLAPGADLRSILRHYQVWCDGELVDQRSEVIELWHTDLVGFLFGCGQAVDNALADAGIPLRHREQQRALPTYRSAEPCRRAGRVNARLRVAMRPVPADLVRLVERVTTALPDRPAPPIRSGDPQELGISRLDVPETGDPLIVEPDDIEVFWPDESTLVAAVLAARPPLVLLGCPQPD